MLSSLILSLVMSTSPAEINTNNINIEEAGMRPGAARIGMRPGAARIGMRPGAARIGMRPGAARIGMRPGAARINTSTEQVTF